MVLFEVVVDDVEEYALLVWLEEKAVELECCTVEGVVFCDCEDRVRDDCVEAVLLFEALPARK